VQEAPPEFDAAFRARLRDLLVWRRDVRRFRREALPSGTIERLIELAAHAPSVGLSQPWRFVLVDAPQRRAAVREIFQHCNAEALMVQPPERRSHYARLKLSGLDEAPCHLAVFSERAPRQGHGLGRLTMPETTDYSAVMAAHTLWLAARAEGIGMGWVSILDPAAVAAALDVPREWRFIGYFCLGYPQTADAVPELQRENWEHRRPATEALLRR
jgi:5,6-dimethylbenzimidazole synthase